PFRGPASGRRPSAAWAPRRSGRVSSGRSATPRGHAGGAFAMTEPTAGSDVAGIQTRARRTGDDWVLSGAKTFISNAIRADWIVVWATVDPGAGRAGHRAFVVERGTPGLEDMRAEHKMGLI